MAKWTELWHWLALVPEAQGGSNGATAVPCQPAQSFKVDFQVCLLEAYKKHSAELASIEDRLNRLLLVILGLFAAGVSAVEAGAITLTPWARLDLLVVVVVFTFFARHYNREMQCLRGSVRHLLVRCETAMGFYDYERFLPGGALYRKSEQDYSTKGQFLAVTTAICILVAAIGLSLVILDAPPASTQTRSGSIHPSSSRSGSSSLPVVRPLDLPGR